MTYTPGIRSYFDAVAHAFDVSAQDIKGRSRAARHVVPRQVLCGLLREVPGMSYPRIGDAIGRDHSTVISAAQRLSEHEADPIYGPKIQIAREALRGGVFRSVRSKETT